MDKRKESRIAIQINQVFCNVSMPDTKAPKLMLPLCQDRLEFSRILSIVLLVAEVFRMHHSDGWCGELLGGVAEDCNAAARV